MGTPEFSLPALQALLDSEHQVSLVLSQPDKKQGRGHKVSPPAVKRLALEHGLEVYQPAKIRGNQEAFDRLKAEEADFFVVIAYGKILPKEILDLPKKGCINVHASLLPHLRGAAPIQFSLIQGDEVTGVTSMLMDEGMDTGDILLMEETPVDPDENALELAIRLSAMGGPLLLKTLAEFDQIVPQKQNDDQATYTCMIHKEDSLLDWGRPAKELFDLYRGLSPSPGVTAFFNSKRLKLKKLAMGRDSGELGVPGELIAIGELGVEVACGQGSLWIQEAQPENKKAMTATEWVNGFQVKVGTRLHPKP